MSEIKTLIALFDEPTKVAEAIDELHTLGIADNGMMIMTGVPYPQGALGRHKEWLALPYIVAGGAFAGLLFGLFLAVITPQLYPQNVGGHPLVGFPPAAIIVFVFTMMATIVSTFLGVVWEMNFPRFGWVPYSKRVTDGKLALLIEFGAALEDSVCQTLEAHGAHDIGEPERMAL